MSEPKEIMSDNTPISIHSLPPELLNIVFGHLYALSRPKTQLFNRTHEDLASDTAAQHHQDPTSPSFFPYAQAKVCRHWREILSQRMEFWDHIVFFIHSTSLSDLQDYFYFSGNSGLLDVTVSNKRKMSMSNNSIETLDNYEASRVAEFLHALKIGSNLHRLRSIHFHVRMTSSLPRVSSFYDIRQPLISVQLKANNDNGSSTASREPHFTGKSRYHFRVKSLTIDGPNFIELAQDLVKQPQVLAHLSDLQSLSISRLRWASASTLSLVDTISVIRGTKRLKFLKLEDIHFSFHDAEWLTPVKLRVTDIELIGLDANVMPLLFRHLMFPADRRSLKIKQCGLEYVPRLPIFPSLILEGHSDLRRCKYSGSSITFIDFPGLVDDILQRMGTFSWIELIIDGCSGFSVSGLKLFLQRRNSSGLRAMESIQVRRSGFNISEEDEAWFRQFPVKFEWTA